MAHEIDLLNHKISLGEEKIIKVKMGKLPSGTALMINIYIYRAKKDGPVLLLNAGMHGDEINGIEILRKAIGNGLFTSLNCGSVIVIPVLNVQGFIHFSRNATEGKDVNRSFPGSLKGSMASRLAKFLSKHILPIISCGIDFHTGGQGKYNYPQIRYQNKIINNTALAEAFNAPFQVIKPTIRGSFRKYAADFGVSVLVFEGGEALRLDHFIIEQGIRGITRVMEHLGLILTKTPYQQSIFLPKSVWIRAQNPGIFTNSKKVGERIKKNEIIGLISDPYGASQTMIKSRYDGYIIGVNHIPLVYAGDALLHIGYEKTELK